MFTHGGIIIETTLKILVLDDEASIRQSIAAYLEDEGFEIYQAASGEEAMAIIETQEVDAAIIDIRLPGMDGNDFMLQSHGLQPKIRFIVHTGSADYILPEDVKKIGVTSKNVFIKPVKDLGLLIKALNSGMSATPVL